MIVIIKYDCCDSFIKNVYLVILSEKVAGRKGFEPLEAFTSTVFKTAAFDHSAISRVLFYLEATPGFEPGIRALQAPALPLGYIAMERETRFELATPTLARLCSTTELFPQNLPTCLLCFY